MRYLILLSLCFTFSILGYYLGSSGYLFSVQSSNQLTWLVESGLNVPDAFVKRLEAHTKSQVVLKKFEDLKETLNLPGSTEDAFIPDFITARQEVLLETPLMFSSLKGERSHKQVERNIAIEFRKNSWENIIPILWTLPSPQIINLEANKASPGFTSFFYPFQETSVQLPAHFSNLKLQEQLKKASKKILWKPAIQFQDPRSGNLKTSEVASSLKNLKTEELNKLLLALQESKRELVVISLAWIPKKSRSKVDFTRTTEFFLNHENLILLGQANSFALVLNSSEEKVDRLYRPSTLKNWPIQQIFTRHKDHSVGSR